MMMSMFSVFDPVSYFGMSINWVSLIFVVMVFPLSFSVLGGGFEGMYKGVLKIMGSLYKEISYPKYLGLVEVSMIVFLYISMMNLMGLFPFVFSSTGHVIVTLSMGLLLWMIGVMMGLLKNFSNMSAHLVPDGSPIFLSPFMVMIELISQMIRPVTLSVRLAANMMAGHLIIGLISLISMGSVSSFVLSVFLQSMMLVLELAVCFIQAFVFSVLVMLYSLDYY